MVTKIEERCIKYYISNIQECLLKMNKHSKENRAPNTSKETWRNWGELGK